MAFDFAPSATLWIHEVMTRLDLMIFDRACKSADETPGARSGNNVIATALNNQSSGRNFGSSRKRAGSELAQLLNRFERYAYLTERHLRAKVVQINAAEHSVE